MCVRLHMVHVSGHLKLFSTLFIKAGPLVESDLTDSPTLTSVARKLTLDPISTSFGFDMDSKDTNSSP